MAQVLVNSPSRLVISNGFSYNRCSIAQQSRIRFILFVNSATLKLPKHSILYDIHSRAVGTRLCHINLFGGSNPVCNFVSSKLMVASVGPTIASEHKVGFSVDDFEDDEDDSDMGFEDIGSSRISRLREGEQRVFYLEETDEEVLSKRILNLSRTNRRTSALMLFRSMEVAGLQPNLHACNSLLACFSRNNMVDELLRVFAFMKSCKIVSGHSCSLVLKALAKHRGTEMALQIFCQWEIDCEMKQHLDSILYNTILSIFGKVNNWVQMKRLRKSMMENGIIGTAVTYRVLVCTFVRCGQYETAIDAYFELLQMGLDPGYDVMQAVIGACTKEEKWDIALSVFHSMLKRGLKPNLVACNALINSLGKAGKVKEAFKIYKHIRFLGHTPDSYTWNALLVAFYRAKQYSTALQFFETIQKDLSFQGSLPVYNTALMCCQRLRNWEKALQFLWKMETSGISVSTESYNIVISACESARKPKVALQIYEHMAHRGCPPDTFTHLSLIRSCIWGDLWDSMHNILEESIPSVSLYNAAIHGMCLRGRIDSAKMLYLKMRELGLVPDGKTRALMLQFMHRSSS